MYLLFESTDWYHCSIYRIRFFFFKQLIAKAKLDLNDDIYIQVCSSRLTYPLEFLAPYAKQYIISHREKD